MQKLAVKQGSNKNKQTKLSINWQKHNNLSARMCNGGGSSNENKK